MPSVEESTAEALTAKEQSAVEFYCNPDSETFNNWAQSCNKAGYSQCKGWERNAVRTLAKDHVKTAIKQYRAKTGQIWAHDRQIAVDGLNVNLLRLQIKADNGDVGACQAITTAIRELNAISNLHSNTVYNPDQNKTDTLTPAETEAYAAAARQLKLKLSETG